jgi:inosine-uridine nucleoside N-ribohydrolase
MAASDLERVAAIGGPLAQALEGMHRIWFEAIGRDNSPMHDSLAVAAVFDGSLLSLVPVSAAVDMTDPLAGAVEFNPSVGDAVTTVRIATGVDSEAFHRLFFARIESAVASCR